MIFQAFTAVAFSYCLFVGLPALSFVLRWPLGGGQLTYLATAE